MKRLILFAAFMAAVSVGAAGWIQDVVSVPTNGCAAITADNRFTPGAVLDNVWLYQGNATNTNAVVYVTFKHGAVFAPATVVAISTNSDVNPVIRLESIGVLVSAGDALVVSNSHGAAKAYMNFKTE
jgi:hypothetical protein